MTTNVLARFQSELPIVSWPVHPWRTRARRPDEGPAHALVIHTSEQAFPTTTSAESLARAIGSKPVEVNGFTNVASYHWDVDLDSIGALVPPDDIAHHAPPNWHGEAICLTGRALRDWTGRTDGVDDWPELRLAARLAALRCLRRGWPVRRLTIEQLRRGEPGICGHVDISHAFGQTNHTDPGDGFPWTSFLELVEFYTLAITANIQEDPMTTARLLRFDGYANVFLIGAGPALHLTGALFEEYRRDGIRVVVSEIHAQGLESVLAQAGLEEADLVRLTA